MTDATPQTSQQSTRPFFILWGGQAISLLGSQLVQFAIIWWLTEQTGSATILATASLIGLLPQVLLGPFIGALVDRWSRKTIMLTADLVTAAATILLAYLFWTGIVEIWHVFGLLFVRAVGGGFHQPAMLATTSLMVPDEMLTRVQGLNQTLQGALNIVAAPLGALLLAWLPIQGVLWIDAITAVFAIAPLLFLTIPEPPALSDADAAQSSVWADVKEGIRYVWTQTGILALVVMAALINFLLMPAVSLLPLLVTEHFGGTAAQFATLSTTVGVGIVIGGILLGVWGGFKRRVVTALLAILGIGAGVLLVGIAPANLFVLAIVGIFIAGFMMPLANGPLQAIMQAVVPPDYQGRVFTLLGAVSLGMAPLGLIIAGPLADVVGVQSWFLLGGGACVVMTVLGFLLPSVMGVEG